MSKKILRLMATSLMVSSLVMTACGPAATPPPPPPPNATGIYEPGMASYDQLLIQLMKKWGIPGGELAVVKDGRLVLARDYGLADVEQNEAVQPDSLFRIAGISKTITATAVLKLVEEGKLDLDAKAFRILDNLSPATDKTVDPRIYDITIRQLLQQSEGWDPSQSMFSPMTSSQRIAGEMGTPAPTSSETTIRFMLGQPLDFDPGSQYANSNFGYCVLGRIIEKVTGQTYYDYVKSQVLEPAGIKSMRLGHTLLQDRYEGEVRYYDYEGAAKTPSVFPDSSGYYSSGLVPYPYGGVYLEANDSDGGWIGSAIDLVRFVTALDNRKILKPETLTIMTGRPALPEWEGTPTYVGMGWGVSPEGTSANWSSMGGFRGNAAYLVRTSDGLTYAVLFNSLPQGPAVFAAELVNGLNDAEKGVTEWPLRDLFR